MKKNIFVKISWSEILSFLVVAGGFFCFAGIALAQTTVNPGGSFEGVIHNPIKANDFVTLLKTILTIVIEIGIPILVISVILVGFEFIRAQGNESALSKARESFKYVIIGAAIIIGCQVIVEIIKSTVDSLK